MRLQATLTRRGAATLVLAVLAVGACAPDTSVPPPEAPRPADHVMVDFSVNEAQGVFATGAEFADAYGTYRQVELAEDAPMLEFKQAVYDSAVVNFYGPQLAEQGQEFAARFVAQHYMDNPAVYDNSPSNRVAYGDATSALIAPGQAQAWSVDVLDSARGWATDKQVIIATDRGAQTPPYESGQARYALRTFELTSAALNDIDGGIVFTFAVEYDRPMSYRGADAYLTTTGVYKLVVVASDAEEWFVSGWGQDVTSTLYYWDGSATQTTPTR